MIVVVSLGVLAVLGGRAVIAQDTGQAKYNVRVPNGLAFAEFKGYEAWRTGSISHNEKVMALILANPVTSATVPASLHDVDFMVKDSKRFADSGGWGWGAFRYHAASDTFTSATQGDSTSMRPSPLILTQVEPGPVEGRRA